MTRMFYNASAFTADISTWDTRRVREDYAYEMFRGCPVPAAHMPLGLVGAIVRRADEERMVMALDFV
jgi:surface protein